VGVYLPLSSSTPIFLGGLARWLVERKSGKKSDAESDTSPAVLFSSGLIAGGAIAGMTLAIIAGASVALSEKLDLSHLVGAFGQSDLVALLLFVGLAGVVYAVGREKLLAAKR
jgi:hypothetical protein